MPFQKHTSTELIKLFHQKPFQGQSPQKAKIIFLSSDANYSPEISKHSFFNYILEYQQDGVAFWEKYDCHHPFLLPNYPFNKTMAGVPFHRNFSKIGLNKKFAKHISFLELLDIPTIGNKSENKKLFYDLMSKEHLDLIEKLITEKGNRLFLIPNSVLKDMKKAQLNLNCFKKLNLNFNKGEKYSYANNGNIIKEIYHFSSSQIHSQLEQIKTMIKSHINSIL
jgi:hypothetical protein